MTARVTGLIAAEDLLMTAPDGFAGRDGIRDDGTGAGSWLATLYQRRGGGSRNGGAIRPECPPAAPEPEA
jgi:hypothetical protein